VTISSNKQTIAGSSNVTVATISKNKSITTTSRYNAVTMIRNKKITNTAYIDKKTASNSNKKLPNTYQMKQLETPTNTKTKISSETRLLAGNKLEVLKSGKDDVNNKPLTFCYDKDVKANSGKITINKEKKTVKIEMKGESQSYTKGTNGCYVNDNGKFYVPIELFSRDFGLNENKKSSDSLDYYSKKAGLEKGEGYNKYSGQVVNKTKNNYGTYVSCNSFTVYSFDNTAEGERLANTINNEMNDDVSDAQTYYGIALGFLTGNIKGAGIAKITDDICNSLDIKSAFADKDYSYGLKAGDTLIINNFGGSIVGSISRTGITTKVTVYDKNGDCNFKMEYSKGY
jgi:hypothetical protein